MKAELAIIVASSLLFYLIGVLAAEFFELSLIFSTGFGLPIDGLLLCLAAFVFSILMYGYAAPLFFLYFGIITKDLLFENPVGAIIQFAGILLGSYAGIRFALYLKKDFEGTDNLFTHLKEFVLPLSVALILCIVAALLIPMLPNSELLYESITGIF